LARIMYVLSTYCCVTTPVYQPSDLLPSFYFSGALLKSIIVVFRDGHLISIPKIPTGDRPLVLASIYRKWSTTIPLQFLISDLQLSFNIFDSAYHPVVIYSVNSIMHSRPDYDVNFAIQQRQSHCYLKELYGDNFMPSLSSFNFMLTLPTYDILLIPPTSYPLTPTKAFNKETRLHCSLLYWHPALHQTTAAIPLSPRSCPPPLLR
jgi:hypothetical protein